MKIATFNINNVNRRLPNLLDWLQVSGPDIACLQELKCTDKEFPADAIREAGYAPVWLGQKTWNGVAILSRVGEPIVTRTSLPGDPKDDQARYIEAAVNGILVGCIYLPNGNPQTEMVQAAAGARAQTAEGKHTRRSGRRLQRCSNRDRYLSDEVMEG